MLEGYNENLLQVNSKLLSGKAENYYLEGYNENLLQINVDFKPISGHFREKNNKRCQISQVETIIFWYSMFMYLN